MRWQDRFTVVPAVFVLLRKGDTILCMRRFNTGYQDGNYGLPSGHLDGGEPARAAITREAAEEVGVIIDVADLKLVHTQHRRAEEGSHERIDLFFETRVWQGEPRIMEPHKCDDLKWIDLHKLPKNTVPVVATALACIAAGEPYSEADF
jgi:8-oxo-dGTP diphosphatase